MNPEFKKLGEVDVTASTEGLNVLVEEGGKVKRAPQSIMGKVKTVNGAHPDANGNVQVETRWNDLKDKPFYTETVEEVILDGELEEGDGSFYIWREIDRPAVDGEQMTVVWNGVTNTVSLAYNAEDDSYCAMLPDGGILCCYISSGSTWGYDVMAQTAATVKVLGKGEAVHKLDEKFLPDSVAGKYAKKIFDIYSFLTDVTGEEQVYSETDTEDTIMSKDDFDFVHNIVSTNRYCFIVDSMGTIGFGSAQSDSFSIKGFLLRPSSAMATFTVLDFSWYFSWDEERGVVTCSRTAYEKELCTK